MILVKEKAAGKAHDKPGEATSDDHKLADTVSQYVTNTIKISAKEITEKSHLLDVELQNEASWKFREEMRATT